MLFKCGFTQKICGRNKKGKKGRLNNLTGSCGRQLKGLWNPAGQVHSQPPRQSHVCEPLNLTEFLSPLAEDINYYFTRRLCLSFDKCIYYYAGTYQ